MTKKQIEKKLTFGGRYLLDILNELESCERKEVIIVNNISNKQEEFLQNECGLAIKKAKESDLLILTKKRKIKEIDLKKYLLNK